MERWIPYRGGVVVTTGAHRGKGSPLKANMNQWIILNMLQSVQSNSQWPYLEVSHRLGVLHIQMGNNFGALLLPKSLFYFSEWPFWRLDYFSDKSTRLKEDHRPVQF